MDLSGEEFTGLYRVGEPRQQKPDITYQVETLQTTRHEAWPLLQAHYDEIAQFKDVQQLDPDWESYEALEKSGRLWVMTARDRGSLIGYITMVVFRNLHYKNLLMATEDIHFLLPQYRKGLIGYRLLSRMKAEMIAKGVKMVITRTKASKPHGALFERLGGELQDLVYAFVL